MLAHAIGLGCAATITPLVLAQPLKASASIIVARSDLIRRTSVSCWKLRGILSYNGGAVNRGSSYD
jgi:hypothetical protein